MFDMNKNKYVSHYGNHQLATWLKRIIWICCSVKICHKCSSLKQPHISNVTVSAGPESVHDLLGSLLQDLLPVCNHISWGCSSGLTDLHGCWQNSVPCQLQDRGPQFLAGCQLEAALHSLPSGPLHRAAHHIAICFIKTNKTGSFLTRQMQQSRITSSWKCHLVTFTIYCLLEASHRPFPYLRGKVLHWGIYTRRQR